MDSLPHYRSPDDRESHMCSHGVASRSVGRTPAAGAVGGITCARTTETVPLRKDRAVAAQSGSLRGLKQVGPSGWKSRAENPQEAWRCPEPGLRTVLCASLSLRPSPGRRRSRKPSPAQPPQPPLDRDCGGRCGPALGDREQPRGQDGARGSISLPCDGQHPPSGAPSTSLLQVAGKTAARPPRRCWCKDSV